MSTILGREKVLLIIFLIVCLAEMALIHAISDLPIWIGNWEGKSQQLLNFNLPTSNFYGPGGAILLLPFLWNGPSYVVPVLFYFLLGCIAYFHLSREIENKYLRLISLALIPANPYLIWLCYSSQDTVFEFALLTWSMYFLLKRKWLIYTLVTLLLAQTRAGYWTFFLGLAAILLIFDLYKRKKLNWRKYLAIPLLFIISIFNFAIYSSPSPALEGGITAHFSYSKYQYLALPKMDMDVFLSGESGIFSERFGPEIPEGANEAEMNTLYQKAAIESAKENPKEVLLATMQKFESYFFGVQKVPHLPGSYVLNQSSKTIEIGDERLRWSLVLGNLLYEMYRSIFLVCSLLALGAIAYSRRIGEKYLISNLSSLPLAIPWLFGIVPALLLYTETRFKVVTEALLFILVLEIWSRIIQSKRTLS